MEIDMARPIAVQLPRGMDPLQYADYLRALGANYAKAAPGLLYHTYLAAMLIEELVGQAPKAMPKVMPTPFNAPMPPPGNASLAGDIPFDGQGRPPPGTTLAKLAGRPVRGAAPAAAPQPRAKPQTRARLAPKAPTKGFFS